MSRVVPGLYDMLGNVWEWTSSRFPGPQTMYVLRGASWIDTVDGSANHRARVTTRSVILYPAFTAYVLRVQQLLDCIYVVCLLFNIYYHFAMAVVKSA